MASSNIDAAVHWQAMESFKQAKRLDEIWGPEPPYEDGAEDKAGVFQQLYYGWIGNLIYQAVSGTITAKDMPPPTRDNRSYNCGKRLSWQVHHDLKAARSWDPHVGSQVLFKKEPETIGTLRWVGYMPQSDRPRSLVAGVCWSVAPRHRRHAPAGSPAALHHGMVHGTQLFDCCDKGCCSSSTPTCSCEPVDCIEILPTPYGIPPPPRPIGANVLWSLVKSHRYHLLVQIPAKLISDLTAIFLPFLLELFVKYLDADTPTWVAGGALVAAVFLTSAVQSCASHKYDHLSIRAAAVFETSAMGVLFEKCLTVSRKALSLPVMSVGRIMNLAGSDVSNIGDLNWYVMYFWSAPLQLGLCIILLYRLVGWCALSSIFVLTITFPLQGLLSKWQQEIRERMASVIDTRIKRTNELLTGIRIVKFMGWEPRFLSLIENARDDELMHLKKVQFSYVLFMFVDGATPILVISILFVLYHLTGHELTPEVVFPAISLLNTMRTPFFMMPVIVSALLQCLVSTKRFTMFLECEDSTSSVQDVEKIYSSGVSAAFNGATLHAFIPESLPKCRSNNTTLMSRFLNLLRRRTIPEAEWSLVPTDNGSSVSDATQVESGSNDNGENEDGDTIHKLIPKDILKDVNLIFPSGLLTIVVGATGSGKSTLLGSLLGEVDITKGELWAKHSIAYVPQQPWIMNATLRENILFFGEEDPEKLREVIDVCQLRQDLALLATGLETEIGEKGINLSGGQKARVSLARAVYADRDMYLMDDPLSALDAHVGAQIVTEVIKERLAAKTRVLATHQLHLLPLADHIVVMSRGRVAFTGTYEGYQAANMVMVLQEEETDTKAVEATTDGEERTEVMEKTEVEQQVESADRDEVVDIEAGKIITNEEKAVGEVPWSTYVAYMKACGGVSRWVLLGVAFVVTELFSVLNGLWLTFWVSDQFALSQSSYLLGYIVVVFLGMFTAPIRSYMCYNQMLIGSRTMHQMLLLSIGTGSMEFFDSTPVGRILNRFTKDMGILDETLNDSYMYLLHYLFSMLSTVILMTVVQPVVLLVVIPCGFLYYKLMKVYRASNRETKRIKSIAHSPVFTLLEELLHGQRTIAVYDKQYVTMREACQRLDVVYAALYMLNISNRWLGTRLEIMSSLIISVVALAGVVSKMLGMSGHNVGLVSLSLTMALQLTETLNWLVRQVASVEANMNCVERILHYIGEISHEQMPEMTNLVADMKTIGATNTAEMVTIEMGSPAQAAPHVVRAGSLEFHGVQMRYRDGLPLVLRDVSFTVQPREKVGIVGRTGSGKSTLLLTFMRMVDICGGEIVVSGRPIRSYGLRELRRQFSMIPQDPVLFDGTVRLNVDPFLEASSEEVWAALELVGLRERIASEPEGIDGRVLEGGSNFSVGQRQLLCMARALLKKGNGFILMDEATANIDQSLDRHIQTTVMKAFGEYTVITIAHRLQTVATYDKIIVMDRGVVAEMGSPGELVGDRNSLFHGMVDAMGSAAARAFRTVVLGGVAEVGGSSSPRG